MWIELKTQMKRLLNLNHIMDVIYDKKEVMYYYANDEYVTESFLSDEQAQARYEEIKGLLIGKKEKTNLIGYKVIDCQSNKMLFSSTELKKCIDFVKSSINLSLYVAEDLV